MARLLNPRRNKSLGAETNVGFVLPLNTVSLFVVKEAIFGLR